MAALGPELWPTLRRLRARRRRVDGRTFWDGGSLIFGWGGVGCEPAARCAADLLDRFRPAMLVSTGFAGALSSGLRPGTIVVGGAVGSPPAQEALRTARAAVRLGHHAPANDHGAEAEGRFRLCEGQTISVGRVILLASAKDELFRASGASAVDMEAAAVARLARERGVGFLSVKAILDTPEAPLVSRYEGPGPVIREILRRPALLPGLLFDINRARTAARALAEFYAALSGLAS